MQLSDYDMITEYTMLHNATKFTQCSEKFTHTVKSNKPQIHAIHSRLQWPIGGGIATSTFYIFYDIHMWQIDQNPWIHAWNTLSVPK